LRRSRIGARWFFDAKDNLKRRVRAMQDFYEETGRQPGELTQKEVDHMLGHLKPDWIERVVVPEFYFNSLVGIVLIILALNAWR
jgi:hypothetical protein